MKLSIIIVSWNVKEDVFNCLESIKKNPPMQKFEIILVDNGSNDGTVQAIRNNFPNVTVVANSKNRGFAAANNQGIRKSQGEYILFLNPDTIIHLGSLDTLIKFMDGNDDVGICGPKLLNGDGSIQASVRRFPSFRAALHRNTIFRTLHLFRKQYHRYMMFDFKYDKQFNVDHIKGAAMITRRSIIDNVGGMDERFFMSYEEFDFCLRIKKAGWRIVFIPDASITHFGARSASQIPVELRAMSLRSMFKYFRKHHGAFTTCLFSIVFKPGVILRYMHNIVVGLLTYIVATLLFNRRRQQKAFRKVKNSALWLRKYSWPLLFKM